MKHILLSVIMIAAIMITSTSCSNPFKPKEKSVNEMALEYLEEKYGEKFEYAAPAGSSYTGTRTFLATCESFGDKRVLVQIENYLDEDNRIVKDDYIAMKYEDNVRELFKKTADEEFGSSKIFYNGGSTAMDLPSDASFEDYLSYKENLISAVISLPESGYENTEQLESLCEKISGKFSADELSCLIIVVDDDTYKPADEDEIRQLFLHRSRIAQAEINRYKGKDKLSMWEDGVQIMGEEI